MTQLSTQIETQGSQYSNETRRQVLGVFVVLGNFQAVSNQTGIPRQTIQGWSQKEWWLNAISEIRQEKAEELDAQVSNSIARAIKSVDERLEKGDAYIHTKTGEVGYKPVSARDSATVLGILYDKRQIMRLLPTKIVAHSDDKLLKLQEKFEALASKKLQDINDTVVGEG